MELNIVERMASLQIEQNTFEFERFKKENSYISMI